MRKLMLMLLAAAYSPAFAEQEQMVWKVVSPSGIVSATVYNDLRACTKALPKYRKGSICVAVPVKKD